MGDLFGFTRLTDGPEINLDVPLTDMAMQLLSTQTYTCSLQAASTCSTGAHSDLRGVGDQTVFPGPQQGRR